MRSAGYSPHRMRISIIRVMSYEHSCIRGIIKSPQRSGNFEFYDLVELLTLLENFQSEHGDPGKYMDAYSFCHHSAPEGGAAEEAVATFSITVFFKQNSTWQGSVYWAEKKELMNFRSVLELLQLLDSALRADGR